MIAALGCGPENTIAIQRLFFPFGGRYRLVQKWIFKQIKNNSIKFQSVAVEQSFERMVFITYIHESEVKTYCQI